MLIALLAVLGVDLVVIVAFLAAVVARRRWLRRQPGAFAGIARVVDGELPVLGAKARRGYGRWVRDVLVWTPAPLCLRNALVPVDGVAGASRPAGAVRRLGDDPRVATLLADGARLEVTTRADDADAVRAPFAATGAATPD